MTQLQQAAEKAVIDKWGADKSKWPARLRTPFRNQSEKAKRDAQGELTFPPGHEDGGIFVNIKTSKKPAVVDESVQPITDLEQQKFYAGCWAIAAVNAYAYDNKGNAGVAFGLESLQKVADGDPLGGRTAPEDVFAPIATEAPAAAGQSAGASDAGSIFN